MLITETTKNWKRSAERHTLARMFEHTLMGKVYTTKRDELNGYFKTYPPASPRIDALRHLHIVADTFVQMLQHRHTADYDSSTKWTRTDAIEKIESVEAAFKSWNAIRNEQAAQNFLVTLPLKERKNERDIPCLWGCACHFASACGCRFRTNSRLRQYTAHREM